MLSLLVGLMAVAFPGAEGFGAQTPGGRGGDVYHVTNLNDAGEGSLRNGVQTARGPRTIVFDLSGTIQLRSPLSINRQFLTLAGQTAPGGGITVAGFTTRVVGTNNVIVRYLRFRAGDFNCPAMQDDALQVDKSSDVMLDHVSASWSVDETLSVTESERVTVQWSFITQSLNNSCHEKGEHGYGTLLRYGAGGVSMHHNLWAHHRSRNPRLGDDIQLDFVNNVVYNHGGEAGYSGDDTEGSPRMNYVGNYVVAGPSTVASRRMRAFSSGGVKTRIFQSGNLVDGNLNTTRDGVDTGWGMFAGDYTRGAERFVMPLVRGVDAAEAYRAVLASSGASLVRDSYDRRMVGDVESGGGKLIDSQREVGGLPELASRPAPADTDRDGIPDAWERAHGLNAADSGDGAALTASGYSNLELYLEELLKPRAAAASATVVDDTFADGDSENQDLAQNSLRWFNGRAQTVRTVTPGNAAFDVTAVGGSSEALWAYFTNNGAPLALGVGDRLTVAVTFTLNGFTANAQDIRWGVLDSQGTRNTTNLTGGHNDAVFVGDTGYGVQFYASGSGSPFVLGSRALLTGPNPFNNFGDFATINGTGASSRQSLTDGVPYTLTHTIERLSATSTQLSVAVTGGSLSGLEYSGTESSASPANTFDYFAFRISGTSFARSVTFSRALVEYLPSRPVITAQPQPSRLTLQVGTPVTMVVAASGSALAYQWRRNGEAITGETSPGLTLERVALADAGRYTVDVFNAGGSVTSDPIVLAVTTAPVAPAPAIVTPPRDTTVTRGDRATLTVTARGDGLIYQWFKNGAVLGGANTAALEIASAQIADSAAYSVLVSNSSGSITSAAARLLVISPMVAVSVSPHPGAAELCADTPLTITFNTPPQLGRGGRIRILNASGEAVDTIDVAANPQTKLVGGVPFNYRPILIDGHTASIYLHAALPYGGRFSIVMEPGVFVDETGAPYGGFSDPQLWYISTRAQVPTGGALINVGTGALCTVQSAIDLVPAGNTQPVTIALAPGVYQEIVYVPATKPFITVLGYDRDATVIRYPNNNTVNPSTASRAMFGVDAADFRLQDVTLWNTTPRGGSQAEAFRSNGRRTLIERVTLKSFQDTILLNGSAFVKDSYIEGDVDFLWGSAAAYFYNCEIKAVSTGAYYTQIRNAQGQNGFVFVNSRLTSEPGVTGVYLSRIDPTVFPYSQVVFIDTAMGPHIRPDAWLLNNATAAPSVQFWESGSTDLDGRPLNITGRPAFSRQLTAAEAARWRDPSFVLDGWNPNR